MAYGLPLRERVSRRDGGGHGAAATSSRAAGDCAFATGAACEVTHFARSAAAFRTTRCAAGRLLARAPRRHPGGRDGVGAALLLRGGRHPRAQPAPRPAAPLGRV